MNIADGRANTNIAERYLHTRQAGQVAHKKIPDNQSPAVSNSRPATALPSSESVTPVYKKHGSLLNIVV